MARDLLRKALRERFQVTLRTGESFDGLLDEWDKTYLTLLDAGVVSDTGQRVPVDGVLWLQWVNVSYMQRSSR